MVRHRPLEASILVRIQVPQQILVFIFMGLSPNTVFGDRPIKNMKICLINNLYKPYARGGAEVIVELISQGLLNKNIEVVVISTRPFFVKNLPIVENKINIKNYYLPSNYYNLSKMPKFFRLFWHFFDLFNFFIYNKVKNILIKENPDIVITHNLKGLSYLLPRVIKKLKIKHVHYLHDIQLIHPSGLMIYGQEQQNQKFFAKIYQTICCRLFGSPDTVISPSKWLLDYYQNKKFFSNSKKIVLANPAPILSSLEPRRIPFKLGLSGLGFFQFLYVGQIEDHKGIIFLINSFNELSKKNKNIRLTIIGDGSKFKRLSSQFKTEFLKFLGKIKREEIAKYLNQADCLIVPSLCYENSPTVIYEAFSVGLPVIASRIGGIIELMKDNPEMFFEPGNRKELINKMLWVLDNQEELKKNSQKELVIIKDFSLKKYLEELLRICCDY